MMELLAGIVLAVTLVALVLEPLVRGRSWAPAAGPIDDLLDLSDAQESESPKIQALLAIKEIEFDRETGKLSDDDYAELKASYQRAALAAIRGEEEAQVTVPSEAAGNPVCPVCGPRPERSATFCSDCGQTLLFSDRSSECFICGESAPPGAKFCGECGTALR